MRLWRSGDLVLRGGDEENARKTEGNVRKMKEKENKNRKSGMKE